MKIRIIQTITNTLETDRTVIKSVVHEAYRLSPDINKALRNKVTNQIFKTTITVSPESEVANYEEIDYQED